MTLWILSFDHSLTILSMTTAAWSLADSIRYLYYFNPNCKLIGIIRYKYKYFYKFLGIICLLFYIRLELLVRFF